MSGMVEAMAQVGRQVAMMNLRADYVYGRIDIEEFERRLDHVLRLRCLHEWVDISSLGHPSERICSLCGERQSMSSD